MILAAGFGTRLKPLTDDIPKALVPYKGMPMINHRIEQLKENNFDEIIINVHHHRDKMISYFSSNDFDVSISLSIEDQILGTGGGILNASSLLENEKYFAVVNVDVDFETDFRKMIEIHDDKNPLAVIAVQKRKSGRYLDFDDGMNLKGRMSNNSNPKNLFAFNGIHLISGRIFHLGYETGFSDIIDIYLDAIIKKQETVIGFDAGAAPFKDLGKIENLL